MSKIYIEVFTPGNGKKYEIMFDDKTLVSQAKQRIIEEITDFENGQISFGDTPLFINMDTKNRLPENIPLREAPVSSGQTLFLL